MKKIWFSVFVIVMFIIGSIYYYQVYVQHNQTNIISGMNYQNPIFKPVLADPSIIKGHDGFYYAYGTEDNWGDGMGARIVPIVRSTNLVDWEYIGDAFQEKPSWKEDGGIWAPDVSFFNGQYYMYYSQSVWGDPNPAIGVAVSDTPKGQFEDQGKLFDSKEIGVNNSIDPQLFMDEDGTPYLFWGSWHGIWGIELSQDGFDYVGEKFQIAGRDFEAVYILKKENHYYFFGSKGSCCEGQWSTYRVATARAESLHGPYYDREGKNILHSGGTDILVGGERFVGPGHISIITDEIDQEWMVYHAIDKQNPWIGNGATRRPLMIDKIIWEDRWPVIHNQRPSESIQKGPVTSEALNN